MSAATVIRHRGDRGANRTRATARRIVRGAAVCLLIAPLMLAAQVGPRPSPDWPIPPNATPIPMGPEILIQGRALRQIGYQGQDGLDTTAGWWRRALGDGHHERAAGLGRVLAAPWGDALLSAELQPTGHDGTTMRVTLTRTATADELQRYRQAERAWAAAGSTGTRVVSLILSPGEPGREPPVSTVVIETAAPADLARQRWRAVLERMRLSPQLSSPTDSRAGATDWFRDKGGREASLTLRESAPGRTQLTLILTGPGRLHP